MLDGIDVFVRVVQAGSFSAAARFLGMPVTTVSGKVAALERRLGVTLLQRTTRKLHVTAAGEAYFQRCVRALEEVTAGERELSATRTEPEGLLRITAPRDVGHSLLTPIVCSYLATYPKTRVELILTTRVVDLVGEGVDLAIRLGPLQDSSLIARKFKDADVFLWASPSYLARRGAPQHPENLCEHSFVNITFIGRTVQLARGDELVSVQVEPRILTDDFESVKAFVECGEGIGLITPFICEREVAAGTLIRALPEWSFQLRSARSSLFFVFPPQRYASIKTQAFIDLALRSSTARGKDEARHSAQHQQQNEGQKKTQPDLDDLSEDSER